MLSLIWLITFVTFSPCLVADFVNWDDNHYIYENPVILDFQPTIIDTWLNVLLDINPIISYAPLSTLTLAIENAIYGIENPEWWHMDSLILHLMVVTAVFVFTRSLGFNLLMSAITSLLFGIHPMRVESVAWLTERKDLLYGLFYFLGLWRYVRLKQKGYSLGGYLSVLLLFVLSLLSKVQAVTFPVALLLIDYFLEQRFDWKRLTDKIPFFALSLAFGLFSAIVITGDPDNEFAFNWLNSLIWLGNSSWAYMYKVFYPQPLLAVYLLPFSFHIGHYLALLVPVIYLWLLWVTYRRRQKVLFFGLAFFAINIVLTLTFLPRGQGYQADRFTYVAYYGLFLILSLVTKSDLYAKYRKGVWIVLLFLLWLLARTAMLQTSVWTNSETLWTHQLKYYPQVESFYVSRANHNYRNHQMAKAESDINNALKLNGENPIMLEMKAKVLLVKDSVSDYKSAIRFLDSALALDSTRASFYINKGVALFKIGNATEALDYFNEGIDLEPQNPDGYLNRAYAYKVIGAYSKSLTDIESYLEFFPDNADIWVVKAQVHNSLEQPDEALESVDYAISLEPEKSIFYFERGLIYYRIGQIKEAKRDVEFSIKLGYKGQTELKTEILESSSSVD